ncbi:MAG: 50S ribosomal protein L1 [Myxococcota bacterium]|nr:50S ribosomal protein L1 [Myxococcota bacterium]
MTKLSKRNHANRNLVDRSKKYDVLEAIDLLKNAQAAKFDESIEVSVGLGVDPKKSDQMVRGVCKLPHGSGKPVRILVFAKGDKEEEAKAAGADFVGSEDLVEKIKAGWLEFDKAIATPDMMPKVGPIARILGPRGLMPNPKVGTVTVDVGKAVNEEKAGRVEFRVDKAGIVHAAIGKMSFGAEDLKANFDAVMDAILKLKPATAKGTYIQSLSFSSTMGPGVRVDTQKVQG